MRHFSIFLLALVCVAGSAIRPRGKHRQTHPQKVVATVTLDQPGTHPFHLKAILAPSRDSDKDSGRRGTVEIWWKSPGEWRREVSCPLFHQIQIVSGGQVWQKNDGDYFPEWLREIAEALIHPVPLSPALYAQMDSGEVRQLPRFGITHLSWSILSSNGEVQKGIGAGIELNDNTGLLFTAGGFGFGGLFHDYQSFHGRQVARTVANGSPEVTAKVITLENLGAGSGRLVHSGSERRPASHPDRVSR